MVLKDIAMVGKAIKSVLTGLKIGSGIGIVVQLLESFQPLMKVIGSFLKVLSLLLSPIQYLVTGLLVPVLLFLKPLALLVKKLMLPFFQLAMQSMVKGSEKVSEGDTAGGMAYILLGAGILISGLSTVFLALSFELLNMVTNLVANLLLLILSIFLPISDENINSILSNLDTLMSTVQGTMLEQIINGITATAALVGLDSTQFENDAKSALSNALSIDLTTPLTDFADANAAAIKEIVTDNPNSFSNTIKTLAADLGAAGKAKIEELFGQAEKKVLEANDFYSPLTQTTSHPYGV